MPRHVQVTTRLSDDELRSVYGVRSVHPLDQRVVTLVVRDGMENRVAEAIAVLGRHDDPLDSADRQDALDSLESAKRVLNNIEVYVRHVRNQIKVVEGALQRATRDSRGRES